MMMETLRRTIRGILQEEACATLNDKIYGALEYVMEEGLVLEYGIFEDWFTVRLTHPHNDNKTRFAPRDKTIGFIEGTKNDVQSHGGKCHGAYVVGMAKIYGEQHKGMGLGALMYDVALELVGDNGLAADRNSVSHDAIRNWNHFKRSSDYEKKPLDDKKGTYTPNDTNDDCDAGSYFEHGGSLYANENPVPKNYFQKHPLNQVVIKKDKTQPTLECMKANNLIGKVHS